LVFYADTQANCEKNQELFFAIAQAKIEAERVNLETELKHIK